MKKSFKCKECGEWNEFETSSAKTRVDLREAAEVSAGEAAELSPGRTYILECKRCGAENRVTIPEAGV